MNILAITTRDYYDILDTSEKWKKIECLKLINFISGLYEDPNNVDGNLLDFFITEDGSKAEKFWEKDNAHLSIRKRTVCCDFAIYVIPCIPKDKIADGICKSRKTRHDYIGTFIECIMDDAKDCTNNLNLYLAAHDLDLFNSNSERIMQEDEVESGSKLSALIEDRSILVNNILGFKHKNADKNFYTLFNQKLNSEFSENFPNSILAKFTEIANKKNLSDTGSTSNNNTTKPAPPILYSYTVKDGAVSFSRPQEIDETSYSKYDVLINAIEKCLKNKIVKCNNDNYEVHLIIHNYEDIKSYSDSDEEMQYAFGQYYFNELRSFCPIIHFCDAKLEHITRLFRYAAVMDCSIWNYFVQIKHGDQEISFENCNQLYEAIESIAINYNNGIYKLIVAKESTELIARMTCNSYIIRFLNTQGHGAFVSPFVFHSEQNVKQMIMDEFYRDRQTISQIKERKWRILLVDDKAKSQMEPKDSSQRYNILPWNCKLSIIKTILEREFGIPNQIAFREYSKNNNNPNSDIEPINVTLEWSCHDTVLKISLLYNNRIGNENERYSVERQIELFINSMKHVKSVQKTDNGLIISYTDESYIAIVKKQLELFIEKYYTCSEPHFLIEYVESIDDAKKALKNRKYDIILLDYLLLNENKLIKNEYGYNLLENIYKVRKKNEQIQSLYNDLISGESEDDIREIIMVEANKEEEIETDSDPASDKTFMMLSKQIENRDLKSILNDFIVKREDEQNEDVYKIGPRNRLFFMFISAYSSAVYERLLAEGLNQSEDYWYINVGACPTNTPQLFLYNLIKLMEKRLEDSHMNRLSIDGIMDDLDLIFEKEGEERAKASEQYYRIQSYQYYFRSLLKDYDITVGDKNLFNTNQSVLVTHFLNDHINMGGMLEHLAQLVHLTGFGTIRQWPEMWEEYLYVKVQLESLIENGNKKQEEQLEHLCRHIENYIKKLKSSAL